jgi:hypothetical protein
LRVSIVLPPLLSALTSSWFTQEFTKPTGTIALEICRGIFKSGVCVPGPVTFDFLFRGKGLPDAATLGGLEADEDPLPYDSAVAPAKGLQPSPSFLWSPQLDIIR